MNISSVLRLSPEAKIRLPNVDEALNIGYAIHSADDPALRNKIAQQNAQIVVGKFLALETEPGSPEEAYLTCVRAIVHSQARGITRRKEQIQPGPEGCAAAAAPAAQRHSSVAAQQ